METKHTPGPWHVEHHSRGSCEVRITRPKESKGLGPVAYALMDLAGAMTAERISEMKANARLIAAAPELLEALQIAREFAAYAQAEPADLTLIDAAIAKAVGPNTEAKPTREAGSA